MLKFYDIIKIQNGHPHDMIFTGIHRNTKIMFHKISNKSEKINYDPHYNLSKFEEFQKEHWNRFFSKTEYVFSFWYENNTAEFIGAYKMGEPIIEEIQDPKTLKKRTKYYFPDMKKIMYLDEYCFRLFIEWTNPSANYGRWIDQNNNKVHSMKPSKTHNIGSVPKKYYEISIPFAQLKKLFEYPLDNSGWKSYLQNRSGVYLILDKLSGTQYIGSAYGSGGFWGRWNNYADNGHGGNKSLREINSNNFVFSILWETLPLTNKNEIISVESQFKEKLGSRVFGLNNN